MQPLRAFDHIDGLSGREPVGAVVTIGVKGPKGNPQHTDRFWVVLPQENENRVRPLHPYFAAYNEAPAERRTVLRGNLVHATAEECWQHHLRAQVLGPTWREFPRAHPAGRPVCSGDGERALRLYGIGDDGSEDWREIACPNDRCAYRQGDVKACKPFARLYFRPRWADGSKLPTPLAKLTTQSWNSISALLGFFRHVASQAEQLGVERVSLYGLPFVLTLGRKKQPHRERAFPVLSIAPECDLIEFFVRQREQVRLAGGRDVLALPPVGALDEVENDPAAVAADVRAITPTKPARSADSGEVETVAGGAAAAPPIEDAPALISLEALNRIQSAARASGISDATLHSLAGGPIDEAPPSAETEILRAIEQYSKRTKR